MTAGRVARTMSRIALEGSPEGFGETTALDGVDLEEDEGLLVVVGRPGAARARCSAAWRAWRRLDEGATGSATVM
jgi:hypothetical protein